MGFVLRFAPFEQPAGPNASKSGVKAASELTHSKNGDALPAEMGVAAERARRLQERRSLSKIIQWAAVELPLRGPLQALRRSRACHRDGAGLA